MTLAVATVVQRVRNKLNDNPFETVTSGSYTAAATTLAIPDGTLWDNGDIGEFDDGTMFIVRSVSGNTLTIAPSYGGTTSANESSGARVVKNPVFKYRDIIDTADEVILGLWPWVWKNVSTTITVLTDGTVWYNLSTATANPFEFLISARQTYGTSPALYAGDYGTTDGLAIQVTNNLPAAVVATGTGVAFPNGNYSTASGSTTVTIQYGAKVTTTLSTTNYADLSDDLLARAVILYVASRLIGAKDVPRMTQEDTTMGEATVRPGDRSSLADRWEREGDRLRWRYHQQLLKEARPLSDWT